MLSGVPRDSASAYCAQPISRAAPSATASKSLRLCKPASGHAVACGPFAPLRVLAACSRALCA